MRLHPTYESMRFYCLNIKFCLVNTSVWISVFRDRSNIFAFNAKFFLQITDSAIDKVPCYNTTIPQTTSINTMISQMMVQPSSWVVRSQSLVGWVEALRNPTHDIKKTEII
jgi:hypothetical protein